MCVCSQNVEFTTAVLALKGCFEVRFSERRPPFQLFLKDPDWDKALLKFTIREGKQWTQLELFWCLRIKTLMILYMANSRGLAQ